MAQKLTTLKSEQCDSNYLAKLHWYGTDGTHHELDLRKLIRKEMKKVLTPVSCYCSICFSC